MLIADQSVYIHQPKTGGSFVTDALFGLYHARWGPFHHAWFGLTGKNTYRHPKYGRLVHHKEKHSPLADIPDVYGSRLPVGTVRNPFDWLVSQFEFGWWKRKEFHSCFTCLRDFGAISDFFPELTFRQFLDYGRRAFLSQDSQAAEIGMATDMFIQYYCRDPGRARAILLQQSRSNEDLSAEIHELSSQVRFLQTDQLNRQLYDLLLEFNYDADDLEFLPSKAKVMPLGKGRSASQHWGKYYDHELLCQVRYQERYLLDLFPEFLPDRFFTAKS
jgi:hypothetical protein